MCQMDLWTFRPSVVFAPKTFRPLPGRLAPGRFAPWTIRPIHVDVSPSARFTHTLNVSPLDISPLNFRSWAFRPLKVNVRPVQMGVLSHLHMFPSSRNEQTACINRPYIISDFMSVKM